MGACEVIVGEPREKQLLKMKWGAGERLSLAGKSSEISAHSVVNSFNESGGVEREIHPNQTLR